MKIPEESNAHSACTWIGMGEGCRRPSMLNKSYCECHYSRIYTTLLPEMATYILDKAVSELNIK